MILRMSRPACLIAVLLVAGAGSAVRAQVSSGPTGQVVAQPLGVEVTALAPPDAFTTPGRDTGLPATLWAGASARTAKTVLPLLAAKPL